MSKIRMAMLLFVGSESVFFILLMSAYVVYHATTPSAAASRYLDVPRTAVFTACLISSSFTIWRSSINFRTNRRRAALAWLLATIALGAAFLAGQGTEYASLIRENVTISRDLFGTTFFALTGFHGLHVFIGLLMLSALLGIELKRGRVSRSGVMEGVTIYWHFVDGVWMVIFPLVYLWVLR